MVVVLSNNHWFLIVLETGNARFRCQQIHYLVSVCFLVCTFIQQRGISGSNPDPKVLPPDAITLRGLGFNIRIWQGTNIQFIATSNSLKGEHLICSLDTDVQMTLGKLSQELSPVLWDICIFGGPKARSKHVSWNLGDLSKGMSILSVGRLYITWYSFSVDKFISNAEYIPYGKEKMFLSSF